MFEFIVKKYEDDLEKEWDSFILNRSINGLFTQTRKFMKYHKPGKFDDLSLCVYKGKELVCTILGCKENDSFFSHKGTTFGGFIISKSVNTANKVGEIINVVQDFLISEGIKYIYFKLSPWIYSDEPVGYFDYFLINKGYKEYSELNYYIDICQIEDPCIVFTSSKRRDYRYSLKNDLLFKELNSKEEIRKFYDILLKTDKKLGISPIHSLEDLFDLKFKRFNDSIKFYGVFKGERLISGSMVFLYKNNIFHTQYLCSDGEYLSLFPMEHLIYNLIMNAIKMNMAYFSFGISTEERGKLLNEGLAKFKEGFGAKCCINRSYEITINNDK